MSARKPWLLSIVITVTAAGLLACSGGKSEEPVAATTPDEAIARIAHGLADHRPEVLWHALPASYRQDVEDLLHEAAGKMDRELWNKTFDVLEKVSRIMSEKRDFILDHPMIASQIEDRSEAESNWGAVAGMFDVLVRSDLADLGKVQKLDVGEFLADTGSKLTEQLAKASKLTPEDQFGTLLNGLKQIQVTVVSASGDTARVRTEVPGMPAKEESYIRVEDRWIPETLASEWPSKMADARRQVAEYSGEQMMQNKQAAMMQLGMVESALDTVLAADTPEQFNASMSGIMGMAMAAAMARASKNESPGASSGMQMPMSSPDVAESGVAAKTGQSSTTRPSPFPLTEEERETLRKQAMAADRMSVQVDEADRYLGQRMRVVGKDGLDFTGRLTAASDGLLTFERDFSGGTMGFEIPAEDIESLTTIR